MSNKGDLAQNVPIIVGNFHFVSVVYLKESYTGIRRGDIGCSTTTEGDKCRTTLLIYCVKIYNFNNSQKFIFVLYSPICDFLK